MKQFTMYLIWLTALSGCNPTAGPPPIVIGHVSDKTRQDKAGEQAELGIRLALNHLNNEAFAKEFGGRPIQVRHTDTRGLLDAFESQAVRLESVNRSLALFGGFSVPETTALHHAKVPLLTLHGQPAAGASNFVFYLGMSPTRQGALLAKIVAEDLKTKQITILLDVKNPASVAVVDSFQKSLPQSRKNAKQATAGVMVLRFGEDSAPAPRPAGESKWHDLNKRLIDQEPDTVLFAGSVQDFNTWHNSLRKEHPKANPQIVFAGADGSQRLFDLDGGNKMAVTMATAFYADPAAEKLTPFLKAYHEAFQVEADVHAAVAYDGFRMLVEAMKRTAAQLTPEKVRDELVKTKDFDGLSGPLTMTADRQMQRTIYGVSWQNGAMKLIRAFPVDKEFP